MLTGGTEVRLKSDPGRKGTLTGRKRELGGTVKYQVVFQEGKSYQPEYELEIISENLQDIESLLNEGKYGRVVDLRRNLSHIQLSGRLSNMIYSMNMANTDFLAYQFKPVLSFFESPANGLLIADEVGLGKTIEAGLIWTELRARSAARRLLVVCPAMLREKWRDELKNRFEVDALITDAGELLSFLSENKIGNQEGKALICSMQGLRPPRKEYEASSQKNRARLASFLEDNSESGSLFDLVVIDESHYLRNPESQTAKLGQLLRNVSEHMILLSATPINLKGEDLFHQLNLVDPDFFQRKEDFPQIFEANEPLIKAKRIVLDKKYTTNEIWECLVEAKKKPLFSKSRQLEELIQGLDKKSDITDEERVALANRIEQINLFSHVVSRTRRAEVDQLKVIRDPKHEYIPINEYERKFYELVTESVRRYASETEGIEGFLLASPQRQISSCMYAAAKSWLNKFSSDGQEVYEDSGVDISDRFDPSPLLEKICSEILNGSPNDLLENLKLNDSKYQRFKIVISDYLSRHSTEKIIVFSYFRGTLHYLSERLKEDGIGNQVLVGGMQKSKQDVINSFRDDPTISVLLSSEVASEGVDLQFSRFLINYDLPWNPMRVEQRIGRIDRIGQKAEKISVWNLCYKDTIDQKILNRLFDRLKIFERALGGMEEILGKEIQQLTYDLIKDKLNEEQTNRRIEQTAFSIEQNRHDQDELEKQAAHLIAHGDYILNRIQDAHEHNLQITDSDLLAYTNDYLNRYCKGHEFLQTSEDEFIFEIKLPPSTASRLAEFISQSNLKGIPNLSNGHRAKCKFQNKLVHSDTAFEIINQFHPLIQFIYHDLTEKQELFYQLVSVKIEKGKVAPDLSGIYVFAVHLWRFSGLNPEEILHARAISLNEGHLLNANLSRNLVNQARIGGQDWRSASNELDKNLVQDLIGECMNEIESDYKLESEKREFENQDRVGFQIQSVERYKERRLKMHLRILEDLKARGNERLIPAREGLIKKLKERSDVRIASLSEKLEFKRSDTEICYGVIHIV